MFISLLDLNYYCGDKNSHYLKDNTLFLEWTVLNWNQIKHHRASNCSMNVLQIIVMPNFGDLLMRSCVCLC